MKDHFVWCPKYRRKVGVGQIAEALRSLLDKHVQDLDLTIEALEIMPDQVHLLIQRDPSEAAQRLADQYKGDTSRRLGLQYPA